ncbi:hypothetical protein [Streptomyces acidiscabies]|uniref:Uncharacterized protein n=1 Tax=Streptomyces acidiscabies TaxID=42234 RepID=A0ABU4LY83_9ACTN|nr:hypothetical protein [Streptomyces acidiscabies]MDX3019867.1 hypothetical protein [Streptomyces acidiscabies]
MQVPFTQDAIRHPLATHSALDVLGYRRNGAPIYAIAGGNGEGEGDSGSGGQSGSGESGQGGTGDSGTASDQGGQQSGQESGQSGSQAGGDTDWKAHAREWEKRAKANAKAAEDGAKAAVELEKIREQNMSAQEKAVAAAEKAGRTAAAQEAQAEIEKRDAQLRELTVRDAVRERAEKHGAKAAALLDSLSFRQKIADLDPSSKTFGANLDDAIKAVVKDNPAFAAQTAGRSGGDLSGGTGETDVKKRSSSLSGAVGAHYQT